MNSFIDFLILLFSLAMGLLAVYIFGSCGEILQYVVFYGTVAIVFIGLIWLRYNIF